ncbi:hypothetical protein CCACVL1_17354 [Corchorus capsularis]|uniref:No apical meristem (NAM) protein n=1 Tax=Corchorus capsularis TaxID=210143 RepID=A0A1R3HSF4_COCAP|nr:hypothetical protein CCACVL1_17354 [Corchorus capsularis]
MSTIIPDNSLPSGWKFEPKKQEILKYYLRPAIETGCLPEFMFEYGKKLPRGETLTHTQTIMSPQIKKPRVDHDQITNCPDYSDHDQSECASFSPPPSLDLPNLRVVLDKITIKLQSSLIFLIMYLANLSNIYVDPALLEAQNYRTSTKSNPNLRVVSGKLQIL